MFIYIFRNFQKSNVIETYITNQKFEITLFVSDIMNLNLLLICNINIIDIHKNFP